MYIYISSCGCTHPLKTNMFHPSIFICERNTLNYPLPWLWVQNDSKLSAFPPKAELQTATPVVASASASMVWQPMWIRETWESWHFLKGKHFVESITLPENEHFERPMFHGGGWFRWFSFSSSVARACLGPKRIFHLPTTDFQYIFRGAFAVSFREGIFDKGSCLILGKV